MGAQLAVWWMWCGVVCARLLQVSKVVCAAPRGASTEYKLRFHHEQARAGVRGVEGPRVCACGWVSGASGGPLVVHV